TTMGRATLGLGGAGNAKTSATRASHTARRTARATAAIVPPAAVRGGYSVTDPEEVAVDKEPPRVDDHSGEREMRDADVGEQQFAHRAACAGREEAGLWQRQRDRRLGVDRDIGPGPGIGV